MSASPARARILAARGVDNVHVFAGGMNAWDDGRRPVTTGRQRWAMERQVRLVAGSAELASVLASTRLGPMKYLAAGVGAGLTYSALSNTCTMATLLALLPYNRSGGSDPEIAVRRLTRAM